jgi:AraC-like DNA-binding protein
MLVLTCKLRPAIQQAVAQGILEAERVHEVAIATRNAKDLDGVVRDFGISTIVVFDLASCSAAQALQVISTQLAIHPFVHVDVIAAPSVLPADQHVYFQLGKAGVYSLHPASNAATAAFWTQRIAELGNFDLVSRVHRELAQHVPTGESGEFLARFLEHSSSASVKTLAEKIYFGKAHSAAYKRRLLWEECKRHNFHSPESILSATRLLVLKHILDINVWTPGRVARHFGFDSARHLNRSCNNRYGMSVNRIRKASRDDIYQIARNVFSTGDPGTEAA